MASISSDKNGNRTVQYTDADGNRPKIRLGAIPLKRANTIKGYIEDLISAKQYAVSIGNETAAWLRDMEVDGALHKRLVKLGLTEPREVTPAPETPRATLGDFVDGYIASRAKLKEGTRINLERCRRLLCEYFGEHRTMDTITAGDADDFREHLRNTLAENTVRRVCGRSKQFFRAAVRKKLISESAFGDMKNTSVKENRSRDHFVDRAVAAAVLKACPDNQWRLIFALCRFGGLRCPSEHMELRWGDIHWDIQRMTVRSPKTAHHEGHEERVIPLWPELQVHLKAVYDEYVATIDPKVVRISEQPVITRYRGANVNLRSQLQRIIKLAKQSTWQKLFQNLRSSRATELAKEWPAHVAAEWMGHSIKVADRHYWRVTEDYYERAVQKVGQQQSATEGNSGERVQTENEKPLDVCISREKRDERMTPTGLEPVLPA